MHILKLSVNFLNRIISFLFLKSPRNVLSNLLLFIFFLFSYQMDWGLQNCAQTGDHMGSSQTRVIGW